MTDVRWARFNFLYRQGDGVIGRRDWALASLGPTALIVATTLIWLAIAPRAPRDLAREGLFDLGVFLAFAYLALYTLVVLLSAVAQYFVSAKRFADRREPPALAGIAPFVLLVAGAAHWYQPRSEGFAPTWTPWALDALALAAVVWNVVELGFFAGRPHSGASHR